MSFKLDTATTLDCTGLTTLETNRTSRGEVLESEPELEDLFEELRLRPYLELLVRLRLRSRLLRFLSRLPRFRSRLLRFRSGLSEESCLRLCTGLLLRSRLSRIGFFEGLWCGLRLICWCFRSRLSRDNFFSGLGDQMPLSLGGGLQLIFLCFSREGFLPVLSGLEIKFLLWFCTGLTEGLTLLLEAISCLEVRSGLWVVDRLRLL